MNFNRTSLFKKFTSETKIKFFYLSVVFFLMYLTRGSHITTIHLLPDASFALFLIGGILLKNPKWFISLLVYSVVIDLVTLSMNSLYQIPINLGYLGLLFSYGIMWFFGLLIAKTKSFSRCAVFAVIATLITFVISTQTYNLLSGTFPNITIKESMQIGWEYLPQSFIYTMSYLLVYWGIQSLLRKQFVSRKSTVS